MKLFNNLFLLAFLLVGFNTAQAQGVFFTEDFADEIPADWTALEVVGNGGAFSNWEHTTVGATGPFGIGSLNSTTADNGYAIFDSDANCSGSQEAWLISPAIDASDKAEVFLQAQQRYRRFQDDIFLMVGTDLEDLASWTEIELYPNIGANDFSDISGDLNPDLLTVNITEPAAGVANFYFAFRFASVSEGCDYAWMIDDVILTDINPTPQNDIRVNPFFAVATAAVTPLEQTDPVYFLADVENIGLADQTNVVLSATVELEGTEVFSATMDYGTVESDSLVENLLFAESYLPTETGLYDVTYSIVSDSMDANEINNVQTYSFAITDTLFARNLTVAAPNGPLFDPGEPHSWGFGTSYHIKDGTDLFSRYVRFRVGGGSTAGETVTVGLYSWNDENLNGNAEIDERTLLGFNLYEVTGNEPDAGAVIALPFVPVTGGTQIPLESDVNYVLNLEYTSTGDGSMPDDEEPTVLLGFARDLDYAAVDFLHSEFLMQTRASELLTIEPNISNADFGVNSFGQDITPEIDWSVGTELPTSIDETLPASEKVSISPNPAVTEAVVNLELSEISENVKISVFDMSGRRVSTQQLSDVQNGQATVDVTTMMPGIYLVNIITDKGFKAMPLTVIK